MAQRGSGDSARRPTELTKAVRAECVLGLRLAVRSEISRAALGWAVGLAALTRVLGGPAPREAVPAITVALGGLLAAAAAPRFFVRGGPLEALRWVRVPPALAAAGRLGGAVVFASMGAAAGALAIAGLGGLSVAALPAAATHAAIVGALGGALAPAVGCSAATVLGVLLVAATVGLGEPAALPGWFAGGWLAPPGALLTGWLAGARSMVDACQLSIWLLLGAAGLGSVGGRLGRPGWRRRDPTR